MQNETHHKIWSIMYSTIREFWQITEPRIEDAAIKLDVPLDQVKGVKETRGARLEGTQV